MGAMTATHEVLNQVPPLVDHDVSAADPALVAGLGLMAGSGAAGSGAAGFRYFTQKLLCNESGNSGRGLRHPH